MQSCAIYALPEMKKKLRMDKKTLVVLVRHNGKLVLLRDETRGLWQMPSGQRKVGEGADAAVRRIVSKALGEATFDVALLCGYGVKGEDGKERGGYCYTADVRDWHPRWGTAHEFAQLPASEQLADGALVIGLRRWSGDFFDARIDIERMGRLC